MLQRPDPTFRTAVREPSRSSDPERTVSVTAGWALIRRHRLAFLSIFVPTLIAGIAYASLARPLYAATSVLLIDTRSRNLGQQSAGGSAAIDSANVDSQVEVLRSESVLRAVVTALHLNADPEFQPRASAVMQALRLLPKDWFSSDLPSPKADAAVFAIGLMERNIVVKRLGLSYVVQIEYRSHSAPRSAEIANKIVDCYIAGQIEGRQAAEKAYSEWLERRTAFLRDDAIRTERLLANRRLSNATERSARAYASTGGSALGSRSSVKESLDRSSEEMAQTGRENAELKEFESASQTSRNLAETFTRRLAEFVPQSAAALSEARVISHALPPQEKSEPKTLLILGSALALGALGGFCAASLCEKRLRGVRSAAQLEAETGLPCLGMLPRVSKTPKSYFASSAKRLTDTDLMRYGLLQPATSFAETMRTIRAGLRPSMGTLLGRTVGVVSALDGEGRSVFCANLAHFCAATGMHTLLIDLDLRRAALSRSLVPEAQWGIAEVVDGHRPISEVIQRDPSSGLEILPARALPPSEAFRLISSPTMTQFIGVIAQQFDLLILNFPAILPSADGLAIASAVDSYLFVAAWGVTEVEQMRHATRKLPDMSERMLGVVLTGVPC